MDDLLDRFRVWGYSASTASNLCRPLTASDSGCCCPCAVDEPRIFCAHKIDTRGTPDLSFDIAEFDTIDPSGIRIAVALTPYVNFHRRYRREGYISSIF